MRRTGEADRKKEEILKIAGTLFLHNGYEKTSMRQIAAEAKISVGLASYHFNSKRELATEVVRRLFAQLAQQAKLSVSQHADPLLYSAVLMRLNNAVLSRECYRQFYLDILRNDILTDVITGTGVETYFCIRDRYCPLQSDEETKRLGWYGNYISASMERTLNLYEEKRSLIPGNTAEIVIKSALSMWDFPHAREEIERACRESEEIVAHLPLATRDLESTFCSHVCQSKTNE